MTEEKLRFSKSNKFHEKLPVNVEAFPETGVQEEEPQSVQPAGRADVHGLHTSALKDLQHAGPGPEAPPLPGKDRGAWRGADPNRDGNILYIQLGGKVKHHEWKNQSRESLLERFAQFLLF